MQQFYTKVVYFLFIQVKDYIKINMASPQKILSWTERPLPNGKLIGKVGYSLLKLT